MCVSYHSSVVFTYYSGFLLDVNMAGNRINTKNKGKDEKNKSNKAISQVNDDTEEIDFSILRKPILTSITGFAEARKIFDWATEEVSTCHI